MENNQALTLDELTERFYVVREQRNRLLWACRKALDAFDEAHRTGKATWPGAAVDEMRMAVAAACAIYQPIKAIEREQLEGFDCSADFCGGLGDNTAKRLTCANCSEVSTNPGQFIKDGRWVCSESCRKELCDKQSYDDLAASGGIVDAP